MRSSRSSGCDIGRGGPVADYHGIGEGDKADGGTLANFTSPSWKNPLVPCSIFSCLLTFAYLWNIFDLGDLELQRGGARR